jgi:hypothetical protein
MNPILDIETGKYYAVEDMLTTDPSEKFGTIRLQDHYNRIAEEGQEYDPYTTMYVGSMDEVCFVDYRTNLLFLIKPFGLLPFSGLLRLLRPNETVEMSKQTLV